MGTVGSIVVHFSVLRIEKKGRAHSFDIFEPREAQVNDAPPGSCHSQSPLLRKQ